MANQENSGKKKKIIGILAVVIIGVGILGTYCYLKLSSEFKQGVEVFLADSKDFVQYSSVEISPLNKEVSLNDAKLILPGGLVMESKKLSFSGIQQPDPTSTEPSTLADKVNAVELRLIVQGDSGTFLSADSGELKNLKALPLVLDSASGVDPSAIVDDVLNDPLKYMDAISAKNINISISEGIRMELGDINLQSKGQSFFIDTHNYHLYLVGEKEQEFISFDRFSVEELDNRALSGFDAAPILAQDDSSFAAAKFAIKNALIENLKTYINVPNEKAHEISTKKAKVDALLEKDTFLLTFDLDTLQYPVREALLQYPMNLEEATAAILEKNFSEENITINLHTKVNYKFVPNTEKTQAAVDIFAEEKSLGAIKIQGQAEAAGNLVKQVVAQMHQGDSLAQILTVAYTPLLNIEKIDQLDMELVNKNFVNYTFETATLRNGIPADQLTTVVADLKNNVVQNVIPLIFGEGPVAESLKSFVTASGTLSVKIKDLDMGQLTKAMLTGNAKSVLGSSEIGFVPATK